MQNRFFLLDHFNNYTNKTIHMIVFWCKKNTCFATQTVGMIKDTISLNRLKTQCINTEHSTLVQRVSQLSPSSFCFGVSSIASCPPAAWNFRLVSFFLPRVVVSSGLVPAFLVPFLAFAFLSVMRWCHCQIFWISSLAHHSHPAPSAFESLKVFPLLSVSCPWP